MVADEILTQSAVTLAVELLRIVIMLLIPWLIAELIKRTRETRAAHAAREAVKAAQQMIPDRSERYAWAAAYVAARVKYLAPAQVQALIEAAVHELKAAKVPDVPTPSDPVVQDNPENDEDGPEGPPA